MKIALFLLVAFVAAVCITTVESKDVRAEHVECANDGECATFADTCHHNQGAFCHLKHDDPDHKHGHCTCHS